MRMGMHLVKGFSGPEDWLNQLAQRNCRAAFCPVKADAPPSLKREYLKASEEGDILLAEVHAWSNMASAYEQVRNDSLAFCIGQLELAEELGANCCVTTAGSRLKDKGPHRDNLSGETFELIVKSVQTIIDEVQPRNTWFTLECMPWIFPRTVEDYLRLIEAVDRERFAVHFDPVNLIYTLENFYGNGEFLRNSITRLKPYIKSCHAKDILIGTAFPIEIRECAPGLGSLDYQTYITEMNKINENMPLMLEHLKTDEEYRRAADYLAAFL
ncbi:MAG: TIM barrel protein [Spirochaetales bacterium]|nr:TIM barrel protein [Spirochaetales bacterium]